jgi:hypothetical protein
MKEMSPTASVDYKNADLSIIVDVIKDTACCSVVPKFYHFRCPFLSIAILAEKFSDKIMSCNNLLNILHKLFTRSQSYNL